MFIDAIGEVIGAIRRYFTAPRSPSYLGRLRGYRDLTEATNLISAHPLHGPGAAVEGLNAQRLGVDVTFRTDR
jgi:hypothetical protein